MMGELKVGDKLYKYAGWRGVEVAEVTKVTPKQVQARVPNWGTDTIRKTSIDIHKWFTTIEGCKADALKFVQNMIEAEERRLEDRRAEPAKIEAAFAKFQEAPDA